MAHFSHKPPQAGTLEELVQYLHLELQSFYQAIAETEVLDLRETFHEPDKPRDGLIVFADGTGWDPGAGRGLYVYDGGWVQLDAEAIAALAAHEGAANPHPQYQTQTESDARYTSINDVGPNTGVRGSVEVKGVKDGYAGLYLSTTNRYFLASGSLQGIWDNVNAWTWRFNNGLLDVGTVPLASVVGLQTALNGKAASSHTHVAADVTNLGSAAIRDASETVVNSTIPIRSAAGDIQARLFRSEFALTNNTINYIMTQIETGSGGAPNNFIRPSTPAQVLSAIGALPLTGGDISGSLGINFSSIPLVVNKLGSTGHSVQFRLDGTTHGAVRVDAGGVTYLTTSDAELKENITEVDEPDFVTKLKALRPIEFSWVGDASEARHTGLVAQELSNVFPDAVSSPEEEGQPWMIDYGRLMPLVVATLKRLVERVELNDRFVSVRPSVEEDQRIADLKGDALRQDMVEKLSVATPEQISNFVDANVNSVAEARQMFKRILLLLSTVVRE